MYIKKIINIKRGPIIPFNYMDMPSKFLGIEDKYYNRVDIISLVLGEVLFE